MSVGSVGQPLLPPGTIRCTRPKSCGSAAQASRHALVGSHSCHGAAGPLRRALDPVSCRDGHQPSSPGASLISWPTASPSTTSPRRTFPGRSSRSARAVTPPSTPTCTRGCATGRRGWSWPAAKASEFRRTRGISSIARRRSIRANRSRCCKSDVGTWARGCRSLIFPAPGAFSPGLRRLPARCAAYRLHFNARICSRNTAA